MIRIIQEGYYITENESQRLRLLIDSSIMPYMSIFKDNNEDDLELMRLIFAIKFGESVYTKPMQNNVLKICEKVKEKINQSTTSTDLTVELANQIENVNEIISIFTVAHIPEPGITIPDGYCYDN